MSTGEIEHNKVAYGNEQNSKQLKIICNTYL